MRLVVVTQPALLLITATKGYMITVPSEVPWPNLANRCCRWRTIARRWSGRVYTVWAITRVWYERITSYHVWVENNRPSDVSTMQGCMWPTHQVCQLSGSHLAAQLGQPLMAMDGLLTEIFWYIGRIVLQLHRQHLNVSAASVRNALALVARASSIG